MGVHVVGPEVVERVDAGRCVGFVEGAHGKGEGSTGERGECYAWQHAPTVFCAPGRGFRGGGSRGGLQQRAVEHALAHNPGDTLIVDVEASAAPPAQSTDADLDPDGIFDRLDSSAIYGQGNYDGSYPVLTICSPPDGSAGTPATDGGKKSDAATKAEGQRRGGNGRRGVRRDRRRRRLCGR